MTNIEISDVGHVIDRILNDKGQNNFEIPETRTEQIENNTLSIVPLIHTTLELLSMDLLIPNYQRPYVWSVENVEQMLHDIKSSVEREQRKLSVRGQYHRFMKMRL